MTTRKQKLTAAQKAYQTITRNWRGDREIQFIANVIFCNCSKAATKLKNLIKLLDTGHEVRSAQFDLFRIRVDGELHDIDELNFPM